MPTPEELVAAAIAARDAAHAPYSKYEVGAALLTRSGRIITGCNIENSSYGLTVCAERTAIFKAVSEGETEFDAIAVVTPDGASMCGACRQISHEFGDFTVYLADTAGAYRTTSVSELLPEAFGADSLDGRG